MEIVTVEKIVEIHCDIIQRFGGADGILEIGTLEYLVYRADHEQDTFKRAAILLYYIASKHPFFDGNKRTAYTCADIVLSEAGVHITADADEVVSFMLSVAAYHQSLHSIELWLREKAT